jgi:hypothetical protein
METLGWLPCASAGVGWSAHAPLLWQPVGAPDAGVVMSTLANCMEVDAIPFRMGWRTDALNRRGYAGNGQGLQA